MKISILATSSAGNCSYVASESTRLLIDAGLSMAETFKRLRSIGADPDAIDGVLLTHEHSDHALGLDAMFSYWRRAGRTPRLYCSEGTASAIVASHKDAPARAIRTFYSAFLVGDLRVVPFKVEHDACGPTGFTVETIGKDPVRYTQALDLGRIDFPEHFAESDAILLESNHDPGMLRAGPYSYKLKQRIAETHLSNEAACRWISEHMTERTKHLMLGHLSTTTNDPEIVRLMASQAIGARGLSTALEVIVPGAGPTGPLSLG